MGIIYRYSIRKLKKIDFRTKNGREFTKNTGITSKDVKKYETYNNQIVKHITQDYLNNSKIKKPLSTFVLQWKEKTYGPGYRNIKACVNDEDFASLELLTHVPEVYFYSFQENGKIYGFDIRSLYAHVAFAKKQKNTSKNPYTMQSLSQTIENHVLSKKHLVESGKKKTKVTDEECIRNKILNLFEVFEHHGYCMNIEWFLNMNIDQLKRWYINGEDLWNYRLQLDQIFKNQIAPYGVFKMSKRSVYALRKIQEVQKVILQQIENLVSHCVDEPTQSLGCIYVLTIFTTVNYQVAVAYPSIAQV